MAFDDIARRMSERDGTRLVAGSNPDEVYANSLADYRRTERLHHFLIGFMCMAVATAWWFYLDPLHHDGPIRIKLLFLALGPYGLFRVIRGLRTRTHGA